MEGVIILGGGLSGLGCALSIPQARVFEATNHSGGHCYSHNVNGVYFDEGAHICHSKDKKWLGMLEKNTEGNIKTFQSNVANYYFGKWFSYPVQNHLNELPTNMKTKALSDFFFAQINRKRAKPQNYLEWCLKEYGEFITEEFYTLFTNKYWRVPMEELGTDWLAGRLIPSQVQNIIAGALAPKIEDQSSFSQFKYPTNGGFHSFIKPMYNKLDIFLQFSCKSY